jgi:hypothetical protein
MGTEDILKHLICFRATANMGQAKVPNLSRCLILYTPGTPSTLASLPPPFFSTLTLVSSSDNLFSPVEMAQCHTCLPRQSS